MFGLAYQCSVAFLALGLAQIPDYDEDFPLLPRIDYGRPAGPEPTYLGLRRGDKWRVGALDAAGNFVPYFRGGLFSIHGHSAAPSYYIWLNFDGGPRYEHRSGRLIKGTMAEGGSFVPELGSRVTELKDFRRDPDLPTYEIWNLPNFQAYEALMKKSREARAKGEKFDWKLPPGAPVPPKASVPASYDFRLYSKDSEPPWVAHVQGRKMELGHLNEAGDFVPEYGLPPFALAQPWPGARNALTGETQLIYYNLPKSGDKEEVYEYRSGRLLQGTLLKNGTFVPDADSKVLDFGEYRPDDTKARRIYNLPGWLVKNR